MFPPNIYHKTWYNASVLALYLVFLNFLAWFLKIISKIVKFADGFRKVVYILFAVLSQVGTLNAFSIDQ